MCSRRATLESFRPYHDSISSIWNPVRASKLRGFAALLAEVETFTNSEERSTASRPRLEGRVWHRWLEQHGVENHVLDAASIEVERRRRRVKTDRIDLDKLMRVLLALQRGEPQVCRLVQPDPPTFDPISPPRLSIS